MRSIDQTTLGLDPLHKKTGEDVFLEDSDRMAPRAALVALIQPHACGAHQALGCRALNAVDTMLRIRCVQLWWNLMKGLTWTSPEEQDLAA